MTPIGVWFNTSDVSDVGSPLQSSVIFVNENENGEKWENNEFVNEN